MSLVDLKSDLSKYRSEVAKDNKLTPNSSIATNSKNFAVNQPITDGLLDNAPDIVKPTPVSVTSKLGSSRLDDIKKPTTTKPIETRLGSTKLDDIVKPTKTQSLEDRLNSTKQDDIVKTAFESVLVNAVSQYSPQTNPIETNGLSAVPLETVTSKFSEIRRDGFQSRLNTSETLINRSVSGQNNLESQIDVQSRPLSFDRTNSTPDIKKETGETVNNITDPKVEISRPQQSFNRENETPNISKNTNDQVDNIDNPNIRINKIPLSINREGQSAIINTDLLSPINNVINPDIALLRKSLSFDRTEQTPNIITDTIKEGLVVNPNTKILRVENGTNHFGDESQLNIDIKPIRFVGTSQLEKLTPTQEINSIRYSGLSKLENDNSELNLDGITPTVLSGRHENPSNSLLSIVGQQSVDFFSNVNASGFNRNAKVGETQFTGQSEYVWSGSPKNATFTNFFSDKNSRGFTLFMDGSETLYQNNTSLYTFVKIPFVNYFDVSKTVTTNGFTTFAPMLETNFKPDSSRFGWAGKREAVPEVNYFDLGVPKTTGGFNKFFVKGDSKYIPDASEFVWSGNKQAVPGVNYLDLLGEHTTQGFQTFSQFLASSYIPDSSRFDWDGNSVENAPAVNYFDLLKQYTTDGFHPFAQKYDSKYKKDASGFTWKGNPASAPAVNYFDLDSINTNAGFNTFAQTYESKYVQGSSVFDWDGGKESAPVVNYFDLSGQSTSVGFHSFAQIYDSKYIKDASIFNWDGGKSDVPTVNYFDLTGKHTTVGFHSFAVLRDSKYIPDSSDFDWDGKKDAAPAVNYFDLTGKYTTVGFHTFAAKLDSKYIPESSEFDWNGARTSAPSVNYFDLTKKFTTVGFHTFAQKYDTKYIPESSEFDWNGGRSSAPAVNYFDLTGKFTKVGFHTFAQKYDSKYIKESSEFDWDGGRSAAPEVNYFDISGKHTTVGFHRLAQMLDSKYVKESSQYDWDGGRGSAPEVNYFDISGKFTTVGFHQLAEKLDSKYVKDSSEFTFKGQFPAKGVNYFENLNAPGFTLNIMPKGSSNPDTEYLHETSLYGFVGQFPGEGANWFQDTNAVGFSQNIKRNAGIPESEYLHESSFYGFTGGRPSPVNFFADDNQGGFTLDIMAKGASNPETEYKTESSRFTFAGTRPSPTNFFPDDNQTGFTLDIMPKGSGRPITEYNWETSFLTFTGGKEEAPTVNYFDLSNKNTTSGFHKFARENEETKYKTESSRFTWIGNRTSAPTINYFGLTRNPTGKDYLDVAQRNNRTQAGRGFQSFASDKTVTNYASAYSILSTESGTNKSIALDKPVTNFFGYTLSTRKGFLPKMSQNDGTLYPIINPGLSYNASLSDRYAIQSARSAGGLTTSNGEEFAPLSLGKRPWANGTLFATLENQVPSIKMNSAPGSYLNKYERTMKDTGLNGSYLARWSMDGQLDTQYGKYSLLDASYNKDTPNQPFVLRGIQEKGNFENETFGDNKSLLSNIKEADVKRISGWLNSNKGQRWVELQDRLYKLNPFVDYNPNDSATANNNQPINRLFNKSSLISTIENIDGGLRLLKVRHGEDSTNDPSDSSTNRYENTTLALNPAGDETNWKIPRTDIPTESNRYAYPYNRLVALVGELLPSTLIPVNSKTNGKYKEPSINSKIVRLSGTNGPNSGKNVSETVINRSSHPYLGIYNTAAVLPSQYPSTAKREIFYGALTRDAGGGELDSRYSFRINNTFTVTTQNKVDGMISALSYLLGGAKARNDENGTYTGDVDIQTSTLDFLKKPEATPFDPRYISFNDRLRAKSKDLFTPGNKILERTPTEEKPIDAPHKQYSSVAYSKLARVKKGVGDRSNEYNDFRHDLFNAENADPNKEVVPGFFSSDPKVIRYHKYNLDVNHGFGKQGEPGNQKNLPFKSNVIYQDKNGTPTPKLKSGQGYKFRGDRINIIDFKKNKTGWVDNNYVYELGSNSDSNLPGAEDLVSFYFTSAKIKGGGKGAPAEAIVFRAAFDSITDNHKPSWSPVNYMGRGDPIYTFGSYERDVSFGFTVHIGSRDEMKASWRKLNYLASWTAPEYTTGGFIKAPLCRLNIGHLFRKTPGFINSLSYTFDNVGGTWETSQLKEDFDLAGASKNISSPGVLQLPKTIQVSCGFTVIGVYRPERNTYMYPLYDDDLAGTPNGIAPTSNTVVNYFRTFDEGGGDQDEFVAVPLGAEDVPVTQRPQTTKDLQDESKKQNAAVDKEIGAIISTDGTDKEPAGTDTGGGGATGGGATGGGATGGGTGTGAGGG